MRIISTKVFASNDDFIIWQKEGKHLGIIQIQPIYTQIVSDSAQTTKIEQHQEITPSFGLFITYHMEME